MANITMVNQDLNHAFRSFHNFPATAVSNTSGGLPEVTHHPTGMHILQSQTARIGSNLDFYPLDCL